MGLNIGWKRLLEDYFHEFHPETSLGLDDFLAIDVDGNGTIESDEIVDDFTSDSTRSAYFVDEEEAKRFCIRHGRALAEKIPFLNSAISHGISPGNPINEYVLYESQLFGNYYDNVDAAVEQVYSDLGKIIEMVAARKIAWVLPGLSENSYTPAELAIWTHEAMEELGVEFQNGGPILFMENFVTREERRVDCDISTMAFLATVYEVGRETGWEYSVVSFPEHLFARATNEAAGEYMNIETRGPSVTDDDFYINYRQHGRRRIDQSSIDQGVYLSPLSDEGLKSEFYLIFAMALMSMSEEQFPGRLELARELLNEAIDLYPANEPALTQRCIVNVRTERFDEALPDCNDALSYDPNDATAYATIAELNLRKAEAGTDGQPTQAEREQLYVEAIALLDVAIRLDPDNSAAYSDRGCAKIELARMAGDRALLRSAMRDCRRALDLDPQNAAAMGNIHAIESSLENL